MIRIVIENVVLFLLPTLAYIAYVYLTKPDSRQQSAGVLLQEAPLIVLIATGAALVLVAIVVFGSSSGGKPGQTYQPSVLKDGKIVPGQIK
jgi:hypothetical protein